MKVNIISTLVSGIVLNKCTHVGASNYTISRSSADENVTQYSARRVGRDHNDAFFTLSDALENMEGEANEMDVIRNVALAIASMCEVTDYECFTKAFQTTFLTFRSASAQDDAENYEYPDDFDNRIIDMIDVARRSIALLRSGDSYSVLTIMSSLMDHVDLMDVDNGMYKALALAVMSVAMESTKLWSKVAFDDESPLHKMSAVPTCNHNRRQLQAQRQLSANDKVVQMVNADFDGAIKGALDFFRPTSEVYDPNLLRDPAALLKRALDTSIAASAAAFVQYGF